MISTCPDQNLLDYYNSINFTDLETASRFHPSVLHVARKIKSRLQYDKIVIPNYSMFEQELLVTGGKVYIFNKISECDEGRNIPKTSHLFAVKTSPEGIQKIDLGEEDSKLNVIILKFNTEARSVENMEHLTLKKMVESRIRNLGDREKILDCFSSKSKTVDNKYKMRIKVDIFSNFSGDLVASGVSDTIINTESNRVGAFEIHDVIPRISCSEGGRKIVMISEFSTSDIKPRFQLWGPNGRIEDDSSFHLKQPENVNKVQNTIIFICPSQPYLDFFVKNGFQIKLVAVRTSDSVESKQFDFDYVPHNSSLTCANQQHSVNMMPGLCTFCISIDTPGNVKNGLVNMRGSSAPHKRKKTLSASGSRNKRLLSSSGSGVVALSPDSGADVSPMSSEDSHHLPEFQHSYNLPDLGFDPETASDLQNINLDPGLEIDSQDVLREYQLITESHQEIATGDSPHESGLIYEDGGNKTRDGREGGMNEAYMSSIFFNTTKSFYIFSLALIVAIIVLLILCPQIFDGDGGTLACVIVACASGMVIANTILKS